MAMAMAGVAVPVAERGQGGERARADGGNQDGGHAGSAGPRQHLGAIGVEHRQVEMAVGIDHLGHGEIMGGDSPA